MPYRLVRVARYYSDYIDQHDSFGEKTGSYDEQLADILKDGYHWSDFMSQALKKLDVDSTEIIANALPLQKQWIQENQPQQADHSWDEEEIVLLQLEHLDPEVLFMFDWSEKYGPAFIQACKEKCKNLKLVVGWCGEAHPTPDFFANHDIILSCAPDTVEFFNQNGCRSKQLHHAFSPAIIEKTENASNYDTHSVGFLGSIIYGSSFHLSRAELIAELLEDFELLLFGKVSTITQSKLDYGSPFKRMLRKSYAQFGHQLNSLGLTALTQKLPGKNVIKTHSDHIKYKNLFEKLRAVCKPPAFGLEMYNTLKSFYICLNAHGPSQYASNMRMFEATGIGTCLLTDHKQNLTKLFSPDTEVVTYRSYDECQEKIQYLINHSNERDAIASAAQKRVLKEHTFEHRAPLLLDIITQELKQARV